MNGLHRMRKAIKTDIAENEQIKAKVTPIWLNHNGNSNHSEKYPEKLSSNM